MTLEKLLCLTFLTCPKEVIIVVMGLNEVHMVTNDYALDKCFLQRWMFEWMGGWMHGWMNGWVNGWMDGYMGGWVHGWMGR